MVLRCVRGISWIGRRRFSTSSGSRAYPLELWELGSASYLDVWALQHVLHSDRVQAALARQRGEDHERLPGVVLQVEHTPVYTMGRGATPLGFKFQIDSTQAAAAAAGNAISDGVEAGSARGQHFHVFRCDRGGQITWHGPGQAVLYPIMDLAAEGSPCDRDLRVYVHCLEECVIRAVGSYGIAAERLQGYPGVWVGAGKRKIGAIGASASRWVTMHGLALNVDCDLAAFDRIVPCGILGRKVTSLAEQIGDGAASPSMAQAQAALVSSLAESLGAPICTSAADHPTSLPEAVERVGSARVGAARAAILEQCRRGGRLDVLREGTSRSGDLREPSPPEQSSRS